MGGVETQYRQLFDIGKGQHTPVTGGCRCRCRCRCSAATTIRIVSFLSHANVFCQTYLHFIHFRAKTSHFTFYLAAIHSG